MHSFFVLSITIALFTFSSITVHAVSDTSSNQSAGMT